MTGINCFFHPGLYEITGERNLPWRQELVPAPTFKDYKNAKLICSGPDVIFKTTSNTGADVFQLNSIKNFSILGFPTLTAVLTGTNAAGSNGVSITNGGENINCEVECLDLPYTVKPSYLDGGKGVTIQNGTGTTLPFKNIKINCRKAKNCAFGGTVDFVTDKLILAGMVGISFIVEAEKCYRGFQINGDQPSAGSVPSNGHTMGLEIKLGCLNCQQDYLESRGWDVVTTVITNRTLGPSGLIGKNPNDNAVFSTLIACSRGGKMEIDGIVTSVDFLHEIGGLLSTGGVGPTLEKKIRYNVRYQGALSSDKQIKIVDRGSGSVRNCFIEAYGLVGFSAAGLVSLNNSVINNGIVELKGTIKP